MDPAKTGWKETFLGEKERQRERELERKSSRSLRNFIFHYVLFVVMGLEVACFVASNGPKRPPETCSIK